MNLGTESIYPDFLRTGLGRLQTLGVGSELLALFSALEHCRRDLQQPRDLRGILDVAGRYVAGLNLFHAQAFFLVAPADLSFALEWCEPANAQPRLDAVVRGEMRSGKFAWALRQNAPVEFQAKTPAGQPERGVFHSLCVATHTVGMFCGLLRHEPLPAQEITYSVLSMLLGISADRLAAAREANDLNTRIQTLSSLLPICAWCKKIRDDRGYWSQIETYMATKFDAAFSHSICPDCARRMREEP